MLSATRSTSVLVLCLASAAGCADSPSSTGEDAGVNRGEGGGSPEERGGAPAIAEDGGKNSTGGMRSSGGMRSTGGISGRSNGGSPSSGGRSSASGGANADGGHQSVGGQSSGGASAGGQGSGGAPSTGGHEHGGGAAGASGMGGSTGATCAPRSSYPAGSVGSSEMRVEPTSEVPPSSDIGAFRVTCDYSHMSQDDPIVYPGQPCRAHLHTFFGNTLTSSSSTYDSLRTTGNSTCRGGIANRTAYWIPTLMNDGAPMIPTSAIFYYKAGYGIPDASPKVQKLPAGLRMIAGNPMATAPEPDLHAYWGCQNVYKGHFAEIIDCDVGDSLQMTVVFPQCWNGVDLDSADHKSHMAYARNSACPATHPVILPEISQNVQWERTAGLDIKKLRVSSDHYDASQPGGYSAHGDWFEAWEPNIRDAFVTHCINQTVDCHAHLLGDGRQIY